MKILIIGATGNVGRHTVDAALDAGHQVAAFGRSTGKIERDDVHLSIVKGDVLDEGDVEMAVRGQDVVILTFGAPLTSDTILHQPGLCEDGTRNVVAAMKRNGTRRLVAMTSLGAGDSEGHGRFVFRNVIEPVMLGRIMKDRNAQEEVVRASGVPEWVIVRPAELSDDAPAEVRVIDNLDGEPEPMTISRTDVGRTLVRFAGDMAHDGHAVVITNGSGK